MPTHGPMDSHSIHSLFHLFLVLRHYRFYEYLVIFFGTILEGEVVLLSAGFLAFNGVVNIYAVILIAVLGAITGDNIWYAVGRFGGKKFIERYGKFFLLTKARIQRADKYFHKHGKKTIFFSRFVFGTRIGSAVLAGTFKMNCKRFLATNASGAFTWVVITTLLGYFFGSSFHDLKRAVHNTEIALLILIAIILIIAIIRIAVTQQEEL